MNAYSRVVCRLMPMVAISRVVNKRIPIVAYFVKRCLLFGSM
jgi:hypothetical protein